MSGRPGRNFERLVALTLLMAAWCLAPSNAEADGYYVLGCMRRNPLAFEQAMSEQDKARRQAYREGITKVFADMVRQPHPALAKPMIEGAPIVMEAIAWDKSITIPGPNNFDIQIFSKGTPQVCGRGFDEIGKIQVR